MIAVANAQPPSNSPTTTAPAVQTASGGKQVSFRHRKTIQVVPDANYRTGGFCRINYLRSKDRFIVTFGTGDYGPAEKRRSTTPARQGQVFKEYTTDLQFTGHSMVFVDGVYYFLTSTAFFGDLEVIKFDKDWRMIGSQILVKDAQWPQGVVYDAQAKRFYVAYLDISKRGCPNARLAAFDRDWRLLGSVAVTNFQRSDHRAAGRPWVLHHNGLFYVSYDVDTSDARGETNFDWQAFVSVYDWIKP